MKTTKLDKAAVLLVLGAVLSLGATGCGQSDEGDGSSTLHVAALVNYDARDNLSSVQVQVEKEGIALSGATVKLESDLGDSIVIPESNDVPGLYLENIKGYTQILDLKVRKGSDNLHATLQGPGPHVITKPAQNEVIPARKAKEIKVKWSTLEGAEGEKVDMFTNKYRVTYGEDTGEGKITRKLLGAGETFVGVRRESSIDLAGGVPGSSFKISYYVQNEFNIQ